MWVLLEVFVATALLSVSSHSETIPLPVGKAPANESVSKVNEYMDPQCALLGGICVPETDCPREAINKNGLCSQRQGYRCCNEIPTTRTSCQQNGGECVDECRVSLRTNRGSSSCLENQYCCLLLA